MLELTEVQVQSNDTLEGSAHMYASAERALTALYAASVPFSTTNSSTLQRIRRSTLPMPVHLRLNTARLRVRLELPFLGMSPR